MRDERQPNYACISCRARAFAQIGAYVEDVESDDRTSIAYRQALERLFGEKWRMGHEKVKEWNARIRAACAQAKTEAHAA